MRISSCLFGGKLAAPAAVVLLLLVGGSLLFSFWQLHRRKKG